jgi:stress-induced morphogen
LEGFYAQQNRREWTAFAITPWSLQKHQQAEERTHFEIFVLSGAACGRRNVVHNRFVHQALPTQPLIDLVALKPVRFIRSWSR